MQPRQSRETVSPEDPREVYCMVERYRPRSVGSIAEGGPEVDRRVRSPGPPSLGGRFDSVAIHASSLQRPDNTEVGREEGVRVGQAPDPDVATGPRPNAGQRGQDLVSSLAIGVQTRPVDLTATIGEAEGAEGPGLRGRQSDTLEGPLARGGQGLGSRKKKAVFYGLSELAGQPAEDGSSRRDTDELADDGANRRLERGWRRGYPEPRSLGYQRAENRVISGHGQEGDQVRAGSEEPAYHRFQTGAGRLDGPMVGGRPEPDGHQRRSIAEREHPPVASILDLFDPVDGSSPQESQGPGQLEIGGWLDGVLYRCSEVRIWRLVGTPQR